MDSAVFQASDSTLGKFITSIKQKPHSLARSSDQVKGMSNLVEKNVSEIISVTCLAVNHVAEQRQKYNSNKSKYKQYEKLPNHRAKPAASKHNSWKPWEK